MVIKKTRFTVPHLVVQPVLYQNAPNWDLVGILGSFCDFLLCVGGS